MTIETKKTLSKFTVHDVCHNDADHPMVVFDASETLSDIFEVLVSKRIFAAPIRDESHPDKLIGVVSLLDVIDSVLEVWSETEKLWQLAEQKKKIYGRADTFRQAISNDQMLLLMANAVEKCLESGAKAKDRAKSDLLAVVVDEAPLDAVFALMTDHHVHRVFVIGSDGEIRNVVTQRDLVDWLHQHIDSFEDEFDFETSGDKFFLDSSVRELGLSYAEVQSVAGDAPIMRAFKVLVRDNLRAVPVIMDGGVVGVISASDFHHIAGADAAANVYEMTCLQFLNIRFKKEFKARAPSLTCKTSTSLRQIIAKIHLTKVHRIYVVNDQNAVVGVVTLGSILRAFLKAGKYPV